MAITGQAAVIRNHPIYWFEDGSLILDVEIQRFKVHHTLLSRQSRFFSDRSRFKHVILEPKRNISVKDVEALLQHLYHDAPLTKASSFSHVASILRVSSPQQLDFPQIHTIAREIFESLFPTKPEDFTHNHNHPLHDALPLATDFGLTNARKAILYSLVTTTDFDIKGANHDLGPQDLSLSSATQLHASDLYPGALETNLPVSLSQTMHACQMLSPAQAEICMSLMNRLIEHFTPILFTPAATPHMECTDVFAETWMPLVIGPAIEDDGVYKPLETLKRLKDINWAKHGLCPLCVVEKKDEWTEEQRNVWSLMDKWLEKLPGAVVENNVSP